MQDPIHDLVIRNGKIVDGSGAPAFTGDVTIDNGIITSRNPGDLDAFTKKIIEEIGEGRHERREAAE